jgi:flagellar FliL protein
LANRACSLFAVVEMSKDKGKDKKGKDAEAPPVDGAAEGEEGAAPAKKKPPLMIIIAAGVGALVILGGGGTAAMLMLGGHKADPAATAKAEKAKKKPADAKGGKDAKDSPITEGPDGVFFYAMADQTANIQTADGRPTFLKLKLAFEAPDRDTADAITPNAMRLNDMFQTFLRELRPEDLSGSQGTYQLRMELLRRVNLVIAPAKINGVLIQEMLIQ